MKVKTFALIGLFLTAGISLSGCCTPDTVYKTKVVYKEPNIPIVDKTRLPSTELRVWGDYRKYKAECEAKIESCNADKDSIYKSLQGVQE